MAAVLALVIPTHDANGRDCPIVYPMRRLFGVLLVSYAFVISFVDAYRIHPWMPIPLAVLLGGMVLTSWSLLLRMDPRIGPGYFRPADVLLLGYLFTIGFTLLLSTRIEAKNLNHLLGYTVVVAVYYFFVKFLFASHDTYVIYERSIRAAVAAGVTLASAYVILEFVDVNVASIGITSLVRFPGEDEPYKALFNVFTRARGFAIESGHFALFFNIFIPISVVYLRERRGVIASLGFLTLSVPAFVVTFSVAGVIAISLGLLMAWGMYIYDRLLRFPSLRSGVLIMLSFLIIATVAITIPGEYLEPVAAKLTLSDPSSGKPRLEGWLAALAVVEEQPLFGTGIGSTSRDTGIGVMSFYLTMLKEAGLIGVALIVLFFASVFCQIAMLPSRNQYKYAYAASFVAGIGHYAVISDIWYPWLWFLCAFIGSEGRKNREIGKR